MEQSKVVAKPIAAVMNPFSLSIWGLLLATYAGSRDMLEFSNWALILLLFIVVLPLGYACVKVLTSRNESRRIPTPMAFFRGQRKQLGIIGLACALPCIFLLVFLKAPPLLVATLISLLGTNLVVTAVNRFFRASYHLSIITAVAAVSVLILGQSAFPIALVALLIVGWSRYSLGQHSPTQLAVGAAIALVVVVVTFYSFGLLGA